MKLKENLLAIFSHWSEAYPPVLAAKTAGLQPVWYSRRVCKPEAARYLEIMDVQ